MRRMLESGGGVLSEFPPGAEPLPWHFPIRNRVISALADVVLVIEAKEKSGSLITADYALEQGKTVFALPGIGKLTYDAISARDYTVVQSVVFLFALLVLAVNLLTDIVYSFLDPRVEF